MSEQPALWITSNPRGLAPDYYEHLRYLSQREYQQLIQGDWSAYEDEPAEYRVPMPRIETNLADVRRQLLDRPRRQTMQRMMQRYTEKREQQIAYEVLGEALAVIDQLQAELDALKNADHPAGLAPSLSDKETKQ